MDCEQQNYSQESEQQANQERHTQRKPELARKLVRRRAEIKRFEASFDVVNALIRIQHTHVKRLRGPARVRGGGQRGAKRIAERLAQFRQRRICARKNAAQRDKNHSHNQRSTR